MGGKNQNRRAKFSEVHRVQASARSGTFERRFALCARIRNRDCTRDSSKVQSAVKIKKTLAAILAPYCTVQYKCSLVRMGSIQATSTVRVSQQDAKKVDFGALKGSK